MNEKYGNDAIYNGEINQEGERHGNGSILWPNGCEYTGEWKNGNVEGKGVLKLLNGEIYDGEFKNNMSHGYGIFTDSKGGK